jgi:hypothetical protein
MDSVNLGSPTSTSHLVGPGSKKYSRLPNEIDSPAHASGALGHALQQQQQLVRDQASVEKFNTFKLTTNCIICLSG